MAEKGRGLTVSVSLGIIIAHNRIQYNIVGIPIGQSASQCKRMRYIYIFVFTAQVIVLTVLPLSENGSYPKTAS